MLNIKQIGYFVAVFETKSFTAAARAHSVTVQAISKSIYELEQTFKTKFFERSNTGVKPTPAARSFYLKARAAVDAYNEVERFSAADLTPGARGDQAGEIQELKLGLCVPSFGRERELYTALTSLVMRGTGVKIDFRSVQLESAQRDLEMGGLDALITIGTYDHENNDCTCVGTLPTGVAVAKTHPLAPKHFVSVVDLCRYPAAQSAVYDDFNQSIFWEYKKKGLLGETCVVDDSKDVTALLTEKNGYYFNAVLPIAGQVEGETALLPVRGEGAVTIPVCMVSLKHDKPRSYHMVESFLVQLVGSINTGVAK